MTDNILLVGSLSNDLFRVVSLQQRGSIAAAKRFLQEAKRWSKPLAQQAKKRYIKDIADQINQVETNDLSSEAIERYLMYGVLLQNYTLHNN